MQIRTGAEERCVSSLAWVTKCYLQKVQDNPKHQSRLGKETGPNRPKYGTWNQPWLDKYPHGFLHDVRLLESAAVADAGKP